MPSLGARKDRDPDPGGGAQLKTTWGLSVYWALVQELSYHNGDL